MLCCTDVSIFNTFGPFETLGSESSYFWRNEIHSQSTFRKYFNPDDLNGLFLEVERIVAERCQPIDGGRFGGQEHHDLQVRLRLERFQLLLARAYRWRVCLLSGCWVRCSKLSPQHFRGTQILDDGGLFCNEKSTKKLGRSSFFCSQWFNFLVHYLYKLCGWKIEEGYHLCECPREKNWFQRVDERTSWWICGFQWLLPQINGISEKQVQVVI